MRPIRLNIEYEEVLDLTKSLHSERLQVEETSWMDFKIWPLQCFSKNWIGCRHSQIRIFHKNRNKQRPTFLSSGATEQSAVLATQHQRCCTLAEGQELGLGGSPPRGSRVPPAHFAHVHVHFLLGVWLYLHVRPLWMKHLLHLWVSEDTWSDSGVSFFWVPPYPFQ